MKHLGRIQGGGDLKCGDETLARADYDFDGYLMRPGEVVGSGELRMPSDTLREVFGRGDLHLLTDDGRLLSLRFSRKPARPRMSMSPAICRCSSNGGADSLVLRCYVIGRGGCPAFSYASSTSLSVSRLSAVGNGAPVSRHEMNARAAWSKPACTAAPRSKAWCSGS